MVDMNAGRWLGGESMLGRNMVWGDVVVFGGVGGFC